MIDELLELSDDDEEEEDPDKYMKIGLGVSLMGVGFVGSLIGNAIGTHIKKKRDQENANKTYAITERLWTDIEDQE